ncbi:carbonic anhydrase [Aureliella helgolandensis]|uniref:Carbonic anhydrase 2 n=1 Tax=Aureliella helgolandensis TaxID=2527968 RepID=A0A518GD56_9BACT|nr:carbonic anhydrase [Aureliella helgolandensis]QDV26526.1 Carbonic anhydrase 2 [Aureliella helgolandensis]
MDLRQMFENNQRWIDEKVAVDREYFSHLAEGQNPAALYIGCSDSRVTAEDMTGSQPGDLFVHRNIANLVPNNDLSSSSVIDFAVGTLNVAHIVVCGHYGCGGIAAAMQCSDLGVLHPWLRNIRDVYRLHREELGEIENEGQRYKRLVELNVQEQCINVSNIPRVQVASRAGELVVHGWVFDIETGRLLDLELDLGELMHGVKPIYHVDDAP